MGIQVSFTPITPKVETTGTATMSAAAAARLKTMIDEEGNPELKLRVMVNGGGCSGFQYAFDFDSTVGTDDIVIERDGVSMVIDNASMRYLNGSEVDYLDGLEGSRFVINNPNATTTCGCGASFSI